MIEITLDMSGAYYELRTERPLSDKLLKNFPKYGRTKEENIIVYTIKVQPNISLILQSIINTSKDSFSVGEEAQETLTENIELTVKPEVFLHDATHVGLACPGIPFYMEVMNKLGAAPKSYTLYTVPFSRAFEVVRLIKSLNTFLPQFEIKDDITNLLLAPLDSFDGTLPSLFNGEVTDLFTVKNAWKASPENFENMGYTSPAAFALKKPLRYIDKTQVTQTDEWEKDQEVIFIGKITEKKVLNYQHALFTLSFGNEKIETTFYRRAWMETKFPIGEEVLVIGKYTSKWSGAFKVVGVSMDSLMEANSLPIVPIYSQSSKNLINTKIIMNCVYELFDRLKDVTGDIAGYIDTEELPMSLQKAIYSLHFPSDIEDYRVALNVLAFYELVYMQLLIIHRKATEEKKKGLSKPLKADGLVKLAIDGLPYQLTGDQVHAIKEIGKLMASNSAEQALVSGDVGSGKTTVAQAACLQAVDNGYQAVLAGPTEVLAKQLFDTFIKVLDNIPQAVRPSIVFLSGSLKAAERRQIVKSIEFGEVDLIVGTHSVLNNNIKYKNLGVVCIDEQQKFGTSQREALLSIREDEFMPDIITLTATPIPRSTAQVFYGDIDLVTIKTKPAGRKPIITEWCTDNPREVIKQKKHPIWSDVKKEIELNHKVFIVVPMVNENEKVNASSVKETLKELVHVFPNEEIEFIHGQMKKPEQGKRIENFRSGSANILIASTVIEVGVDIPLATRVVILSADRLGASSLHQIRGRVGRNDLQSKCYLVSSNLKENNQARLGSLVDSNDGFEIATKDLETRGEGDLFGTAQAGGTQLTFASLVNHAKHIDKAREVAEKIYLTPRKVEAILDAEAVLKIDKKES